MKANRHLGSKGFMNRGEISGFWDHRFPINARIYVPDIVSLTMAGVGNPVKNASIPAGLTGKLPLNERNSYQNNPALV